jgi:opacity protein-like surface antigen
MRQGFCFKTVFLSVLLLSVPSLASAKPRVCPCPAKRLCVSPVKRPPSWYLDAGLGWMFNQNLGKTYLANMDLPADQYNASKSKRSLMGFWGGGYVWARQTQWFPFTSVGLEYSYNPPVEVKGVIEEMSDPEQANFNYKFKVSHHTLRLVGKADLVRWQNWMPYLSGGVGTSWNRFSNYSEEATTDAVSPRPAPAFPNKTQVNFSYDLGVGVDYIFTENLWGGVGYRYDHFGWGKTGDTNAEFADKSLKNTLRAHTIIFSLRYLFG